MNRISKIYIILLLIIFSLIIFVYFSISRTQEKLTDSIINLYISQAQHFSKNISKQIKEDVPDNLYKTLKNNVSLRKNLEDKFKVLSTDSFKYIYVLYKDKNNQFRYLLDSSEHDRGSFDDKLDIDTKNWLQVYKNRKEKTLYQKNLDTLWATYLKPIVTNGKVEGIISIDFSTKLINEIKNIIKPIDDFFLYIFILIFALILILAYQSILNMKAKKYSNIDPLTQAYNRNFLRIFMEKIDLSKYQILMLDIDYFKKINDNYGHQVGDEVLQEVASIIRDAIRQKDIFIRFGGEEFLIFIDREKSPLKIAEDIGQRIRKSIESHNYIYNKKSLKVTISIGACLYPQHFKTPISAIKNADELLYAAKRRGRNMLVSDSNKKEDGNQSSMSIDDVKDAIEENRLICHYQPIINLNNNKIVKYEALVRILKEDEEIILPGEFLPNITNTNIYIEMTRVVIEKVFDTIREKNIELSMNLNLSDILDNKIFNILKEEIEKNLLLAKNLTIELLEYENIATPLLQKKLKEIKSYGVKIAIDDFGSGYSNFSVFQTLSIDILKIDGSLIKNLDSSKTSYQITKAISIFSKNLGIKVIAEYIHNEKISNIVRDLGIEFGQGFYFYKPSPYTL